MPVAPVFFSNSCPEKLCLPSLCILLLCAMARPKPPLARLHELTVGQYADFFVLLAKRRKSTTRDGKPFLYNGTYQASITGGWYHEQGPASSPASRRERSPAGVLLVSSATCSGRSPSSLDASGRITPFNISRAAM